MKLRIMLFAVAVSFAATAIGEVGYKFYGQVRADLFYNSRSNSETVDGLFYMYPKDKELDADGKDLNAKPDGRHRSSAAKWMFRERWKSIFGVAGQIIIWFACVRHIFVLILARLRFLWGKRGIRLTAMLLPNC